MCVKIIKCVIDTIKFEFVEVKCVYKVIECVIHKIKFQLVEVKFE